MTAHIGMLAASLAACMAIATENAKNMILACRKDRAKIIIFPLSRAFSAATFPVESNMPLPLPDFIALFALASKPYARYEATCGGKDKLYALFHTLGQARFVRLVQGFYPDQLKSIMVGLSVLEQQQVGNMTLPTLVSLREVNATWIKSVLRVATNVNPVISILVAPNSVVQTLVDPARANHLVTEVNAAMQSPRNLIFDNRGTCVAEINFFNHGMTATSGHAHIYPVGAMPITGHHVSGVPHFGQGDYPPAWRALPAGITPARALWT